MNIKWFIVGITSINISSISHASDCVDAIDNYSMNLDEVSFSIRRYASCLSTSEGRDDCSIEFERLKQAHFDFEMSVSEIESYCED